MPQVKPMTVEQAQRLALASGAKLRIAGRTFNAGMEREDLAGEVQQPAPEPAPGAEMPEAQPQQDVSAPLAALAEAVARSSEATAALAERVGQMSAASPQQPQPREPKAWRMRAIYDELGQFTTLICTSETRKYRIDVKRNPTTARMDDFVCYPIPMTDEGA